MCSGKTKPLKEYVMDMEDRTLIKTLNYKLGYQVRTYEYQVGTEDTMTMRSAFTRAGAYIGNPKMARFLIIKKGIVADTMQPLGPGDGNGGFGRTCCTGFNPEEEKWYGWSHRAIHGFEVGDVAKKGDAVTETGWIVGYVDEHPEADLSVPVGFTAETLIDAQRMAIAFAESVG